ncbi:MAG: hypothetical protein ACRD2X_15135, partial [Vicinamibacteraceae bacterium]
MTVELALAVILMVGAGLLIKSLWQLQRVDPGFRTAGVLKAEYQLPGNRYPLDFPDGGWPEVRRFSNTLVDRAATIPGVRAVAIAGNH